MSFWLWGFLTAFLGGVLVAVINFALSCLVVCKKPEIFPLFTLVRQVLNVGYLVLVWFVTPHTPWSLTPLLVGAVLGITAPMLVFTPRLAALSHREQSSKGGDDCGQ